MSNPMRKHPSGTKPLLQPEGILQIADAHSIDGRMPGRDAVCATLCYMKEYRDIVGVRELRQNLSVYLRRVAAGQRLRVTDRGRIVAALVPLREAASVLEGLVKQGRLLPA